MSERLGKSGAVGREGALHKIASKDCHPLSVLPPSSEDGMLYLHLLWLRVDTDHEIITSVKISF